MSKKQKQEQERKNHKRITYPERPPTDSCKENGRCLTVNAPVGFSIKKIHVDGKLITDNTVEKCDYAFEVRKEDGEGNISEHTYILVELKGSRLRKAISQLSTSIDILVSHYQSFDKKHAYAICSEIRPQEITSSDQVLIKRLKKRRGFILTYHSDSHTHEVQD